MYAMPKKGLCANTDLTPSLLRQTGRYCILGHSEVECFSSVQLHFYVQEQ